jgi:hypothetical protein
VFLIAFLIGAQLLFILVILLGLHPTDNICAAQPWIGLFSSSLSSFAISCYLLTVVLNLVLVGHLGVALLYGGLFVKTHRSM